MRLGTLPGYLVGSRKGIVELAENRWTLVLGLLLVLSAGLARYYDGAFLLKEWDVLVHGVLVAAGNAFVLYTLTFLAVLGNKENTQRPKFWSGYLTFLGLFWMTAPMAWLYAIPYERFLTPLGALHANQITLAVVSVWRIALITRVLSVIFGASALRVFFIVMLFADATMLAAAIMMPKPILIHMGGIQQTEVERAIVGSTFAIIQITVVTFLLWLLAALVASRKIRARWSIASPRWSPTPRLGLALAGVAIAAWIPALRLAQPEQQLRHSAEQLLASERVDEAFTEMSSHHRSEYPPVWDPAPRPGWGEKFPPMSSIRRALVTTKPAPWVRDIYIYKSWATLSPYMRPLEPTTTPREILDSAGYTLAEPDGFRFHADHDPRLSEAQREACREAAAFADERRQEDGKR